MSDDDPQAPLATLHELLEQLGEDSSDDLPAIDPEDFEESARLQESSLPFSAPSIRSPQRPEPLYGYNLDWIAGKLLRNYGLGNPGTTEILELLSFPTQPLYETWEDAKQFLDDPRGIVLAYFWLGKTSYPGPVGLIGIADSADEIYSQIHKADSFDLEDPSCPELRQHNSLTVPGFPGTVNCLFGNSNGFYGSLVQHFNTRGLSHLISTYSLNSYE